MPKFHGGTEQIDFENYKKQLNEAEKSLANNEIDEIPLALRPKMLDFDYQTQTYIVVSYSRKDFVKVYLLLWQLYNAGYRFWYDNDMEGRKKWIEEYSEKYTNPNCLGSLTFFSDNYVSDSTKEELSIMYHENDYKKCNFMISLTPWSNFDATKVLKNAIANDRITIPNANDILPILKNIIEGEKEKTIHRYDSETDISYLIDKIGKVFNICSKLESKPKKYHNIALNFSPKGEMVYNAEESKNPKTTQNIFIKGQNENAIKHLFTQYASKADIIYIDPPFYSGATSFSYQEDENEWERMIEHRLIMARALLSESGVVFIYIDESEEHTLKTICHNIFGKENFVGSIILANYRKTFASKFASGTHDYILVYAKSHLYEIKKSISSVWDNSIIGYSYSARAETEKLINTKELQTYDKTVGLIKKLISIAGNNNALVLDLYSRAGATAHSIMELNAENGGKRNYILLQGTENEEGDKVQASLIRKRIDLAGNKITEAVKEKDSFDDGFIVYDINL